MEWHIANENWALYAASVPAIIVFVAVGFALWRRSTGGVLRAKLAVYQRDARKLKAARKKQSAAVDRFRRLQKRADKVKPRVLQGAKDAAADSSALVRIADDRMQVSANQLRKYIFEEFPPVKQQRLREKYLPADEVDGRPFNF